MENHAKNGKIITKYKQYLKLEKSFSSNTIDAYLTDLDKLMAYLTLEGKDCLEVTLDDLETFSAGLHDIGINARSQARILSGVRAFYRFLYWRTTYSRIRVSCWNLRRQAVICPTF